MKEVSPGFLGLTASPGTSRCAAAVLGPPSAFFAAVLQASLQVELFDEEMGFEPFRKGIVTGRYPAALADGKAEEFAGRGTFVFRVGYPPERPVTAALPGGAVVVFSPSGLPGGWEEVLPREKRRLLLLGRRTGAPAAGRKAGLTEDLSARILVRKGSSALGRKRFPSAPLIIIDPLVLDPPVLPVSGNVEPGGLGWYLLTDLLRVLCTRQRPAGAVLLPCRLPRRDPVAAFILARLAAKLLAYVLSTGRDSR
jgi:hypothetical protein